MEKVEPSPSAESIELSLRGIRSLFLRRLYPTTRPEISEIVSAVENPEAMINSYACSFVRCSDSISDMMPFEIA